ncbi:hypothetical protein [Microcoleus sp. BR0-C5]|uniref:hypothetical protein n=1 Tax=Microcoleus sp. BR0-C5 TaxID=2818713 RepID=UPI002FD6A5F0
MRSSLIKILILVDDRRWMFVVEIWQKDSQEQASCLFHNNYGRCLVRTCIRHYKPI